MFHSSRPHTHKAQQYRNAKDKYIDANTATNIQTPLVVESFECEFNSYYISSHFYTFFLPIFRSATPCECLGDEDHRCSQYGVIYSVSND